MYCPRCEQYYTDGERRCPACRKALEAYAYVTLTLTREEAREGCRKSVPFPGMYRPVTLSLIPGLREGQTLSVRNARFSVDEDDYETGLLEIGLKVKRPEKTPGEEEQEEEEAEEKPASKEKKKGGGFWAHAAACLSILPLTVLMTVGLFYLSARNVFDAAGRDLLLVLAAVSVALLLLLRLTVRRTSDTLRRNALILAVSLLLAVLFRFVPPLLGVDYASAAGKLHDAVYALRPEQETDGPVPVLAVSEENAASEAVPAAVPVPVVPAADKSAAAAVIPNFEHRYFLNLLSPEELDNFTALYQSIASFSPVCVFPHAISRDGVDMLTTLILTECPELMQVNFTAGYYTLSLFNGKIRSMDIPYAMDRDEYTAKLTACRTFIDGAVRQMDGMDVYEKEQYVYELIVSSCTYSLVAPDASNAYGALIAGHAKCDGISLAAKWLLEEAGVTAVVLTGKENGMSVGHAWNAVLIDGVFCHLDITNDANNDGALLYPAFNVPERCLTDLYPYDEVFASRFPLPSAQGYDKSFHYRGGTFIAAGADPHRVLEKKVKAVYKKGGGSFVMQFESEADYRAFLNGLDGSLASLYADTLNAGGRYAYNILDDFRTVRITLSFS